MKPLQTRKDSFYDELIPYVNEYGKDLIREFYDYWIEHKEPVTAITKLRFEKQSTWQLSRRVRTWRRNNDNWNTGKKVRNDNILTQSFEQYRNQIEARN